MVYQEMNINDKYQEIISKCKFISKSDCWFIEGSEAKCDGNYNDYKEGDKFNNGWSLFNGIVQGGEDGETCPFEEFLIYDKFGNEISELTLDEYISILRDQKINGIFNDK